MKTSETEEADADALSIEARAKSAWAIAL